MPRSRVGKGLTQARGPVHGNFEEGSRITQAVMAILQSGSSWPMLSAGQKEGAHMIVHKLHRIVTGNPMHRDHWDDVGGYAQLGADACDATEPVAAPTARMSQQRKAKPARVRVAKKAAKKKVAARPAKKAAKRPPAKKRVAAARTVRSPARRPRAVRPAASPVTAPAAPAQQQGA